MDLIEGDLIHPIKHWYYRHKFSFISMSDFWNHDSKISLVDIGAGSALFSKELVRMEKVDKSVAVDTGYSEDFDDRESGISYRREIEYPGFTHFLLTDVLEHIQDDCSFLKEIVSNSDRGSAFMITVPAHMSLWSGHDVYLNHFRRYTKASLQKLVLEAGLNVKTIRYTYSTVFPIAYVQRKLLGKKSSNSQMKDHGWFIGCVLRILLIPDRRLSFLPFGVSLYLEARND
jgi:hypothetical protein